MKDIVAGAIFKRIHRLDCAQNAFLYGPKTRSFW